MLGRRRRAIALAVLIVGAAVSGSLGAKSTAAAALACDYEQVDWSTNWTYTYQYDCQESSPMAGCYYAAEADPGYEWRAWTCEYPYYIAGDCDPQPPGGCRMS